MTESRSAEVIVAVGGHPAREPDATCEGCGTRGTVGRATRYAGEQGLVVEQHRYCARCWPEWSAFYRARWEDESRRASLAWRDLPREDRDTPPPRPTGGVLRDGDMAPDDRARSDTHASGARAERRTADRRGADAVRGARGPRRRRHPPRRRGAGGADADRSAGVPRGVRPRFCVRSAAG